MNHSHGYEMRLQTARNLAQEAAAVRRREAQRKREVRDAIDRLARALDTIEKLPAILAAYELTGDHDHSLHGTRPLPPGYQCSGGGDCLVYKARKVIEALGLQPKT